MPVLASTILTNCRTGLLNDPTGAIYADTPMYSLMNKAYRELQNKTIAYGVQTTKEHSSAITVLAGVDFLGDGAGLPVDFVSPISLKERRQGSTSTEDYVDMTESSDEPQWKPSDMLLTWAWREEQIHFPTGGSTVNKEVMLTYWKGGNISGAASPITIYNCEEWLSQRTAILACITIGNNPTRAGMLKNDLVDIWDDLKVVLTRRNQNRPVRRRRTRYRVK